MCFTCSPLSRLALASPVQLEEFITLSLTNTSWASHEWSVIEEKWHFHLGWLHLAPSCVRFRCMACWHFHLTLTLWAGQPDIVLRAKSVRDLKKIHSNSFFQPHPSIWIVVLRQVELGHWVLVPHLQLIKNLKFQKKDLLQNFRCWLSPPQKELWPHYVKSLHSSCVHEHYNETKWLRQDEKTC